MKNTPAYNINVVIRETGLKPDTLRAWERRYGLPKPIRTEGGHRLYSERDIATIQWLIERQNEGLRIKQAVNLWNEYEQSGQDPLKEKVSDSGYGDYFQTSYQTSPELEEIRDRWVQACLDYNERSAIEITNYAFALYPPEIVCFEVLLAGLAEIGAGWYQGTTSIQQEHFASALVIRRLETLISATPVPTRQGSILVGCPPGEDHTISPLMLTFLLRVKGWHVIYLGANIPQTRLGETLKTIKPRLVILTAQHLSSAASLVEIGNYLIDKEIHLAFGGQVFIQNPDLFNSIPGLYLGDRMQDAVPLIEKIIADSPSLPEPKWINDSFKYALQHYNSIQPQLDFLVLQSFSNIPLDPNQISIANQFMSQNIQAALKLGNMAYLQSEYNWIFDLFQNHELGDEMLRTYIDIYYHNASTLMDKRGAPILEEILRLKTIRLINRASEK